MFQLFDNRHGDDQLIAKLNEMCTLIVDLDKIVAANYRVIENKANGRVFVPISYCLNQTVHKLNIDGTEIDVANVIWQFGVDMFDETDQWTDFDKTLPYPNRPFVANLYDRDDRLINRGVYMLGYDRHSIYNNQFKECSVYRLKYADDRIGSDADWSTYGKARIEWKYWM